LKISVVIPCLNEERFIGALLDTLAKQDVGGFEILIADGLSTDRTLKIIKQFIDTNTAIPLRLVSNQSRSIPSALNLAIQQAAAGIIVRLDAHSRPPHDYLRKCYAVLTASGAEVVGGSWNIRPGGEGLVPQAIALAVSSIIGAGDAHYRLTPMNRARDVDTVPFGCFRRETWQALGGYDERLLANEDYEFNTRVRLRGGRVHFDPGIRCEYFARPTLRALVKQYWRYGWWKSQMLKMHPRSLKARQLIPFLWVAVSIGLPSVGLFSQIGSIAALLLWCIYFSVLVSFSGILACQNGWRLWLPIVASFAVIHFSWGLGAWAGLFRNKRT